MPLATMVPRPFDPSQQNSGETPAQAGERQGSRTTSGRRWTAFDHSLDKPVLRASGISDVTVPFRAGTPRAWGWAAASGPGRAANAFRRPQTRPASRSRHQPAELGPTRHSASEHTRKASRWVSTRQTRVLLGCFAAMDSDESGAFAGQIGSAMVTRREPPTP